MDAYFAARPKVTAVRVEAVNPRRLSQTAVVVALVTVKAQRNGTSAMFPEVHVWRLRDGLVTEFREYQGDEHREDRFWS